MSPRGRTRGSSQRSVGGDPLLIAGAAVVLWVVLIFVTVPLTWVFHLASLPATYIYDDPSTAIMSSEPSLSVGPRFIQHTPSQPGDDWLASAAAVRGAAASPWYDTPAVLRLGVAAPELPKSAFPQVNAGGGGVPLPAAGVGEHICDAGGVTCYPTSARGG